MGAVHRISELRLEFWDRVRAQDIEGAQSVRQALYDYPKRIGYDPHQHRAVSAAWGAASADADLNLGFIGKVETPREVSEIIEEVWRLEREFQEPAHLLSGVQVLTAWKTIIAADERLKALFASLDPKLRRHPVLPKAMANSKHGLFTANSGPMPSLSEEERTELKRRRMYQWTQDEKSMLFLTELSPTSDDAIGEWLEDELKTEQRINELFSAAGGRFVGLYRILDEQRPARLLTYRVDSDEGSDNVRASLTSSGLITIHRTTRVLTPEEIWYSNAEPFRFLTPLDLRT